jgi:arginase family enzyme
MRLVVVDLDGAILTQPFIASLIEAGEVSIVPAVDLAPHLRLIADRAALEELQARITGALGRVPSDLEMVFYGSGDFHHLTVRLLERHHEPVTVVHIDNHPDWVMFPRTLNCGSWVTHALALRCVAQIITVGPSGKDLEWPEFKFGNLKAVVDGKLKVFPWRKTESTVMRKYGDTACWRQRGSRLEWVHLSDRLWTEAAAELVSTLPTSRVYLTIDKDAIRHAEAATNWDQGLMTVEQIEVLIAALARDRQIVGVDVCGDYSAPRVRGLLRRIVSFTDRDSVAVKPEALSINSDTNARLLSAISALASRAVPDV